jgi:hypothetical protein
VTGRRKAARAAFARAALAVLVGTAARLADLVLRRRARRHDAS